MSERLLPEGILCERPAVDRFFWLYAKHKTVPPAIFYLLVINRFLKPNRISPYLSRRIYPVLTHARTHARTYTVDVVTSEQRAFSQADSYRSDAISLFALRFECLNDILWKRNEQVRLHVDEKRTRVSKDNLSSSPIVQRGKKLIKNLGRYKLYLKGFKENNYIVPRHIFIYLLLWRWCWKDVGFG